MTANQIEALTHIHLYGNSDLSHISGTVLLNCCKKGWLMVDENQSFPFGETLNTSALILTDFGRRELHEATR